MSSQVIVSTGRKRSRVVPSTVSKKRRGTKRGRQPYVSIGRSFPEHVRTSIRYCDVKTFGAPQASSSISKIFYKANGIYDPDSAVGGHQPLGFDQWTAIYNHWVVNSATIRCTFYINSDTTLDAAFLCGIYDDDDATNSLSVSELQEGSGRNRSCMVTTNHPQNILYATWKSKRKFSSNQLADVNQRGTSSADPSESSQWCIWAYNYGINSDRVDVNIDIEYDVTFFERKDLAGS